MIVSLSREVIALRKTVRPFQPRPDQPRIIMSDPFARRFFIHRIHNLKRQNILLKDVGLNRHLDLNRANA